MTSRLIDSLDAKIESGNDVVSVYCLRAERAAYLARRGDTKRAASEIADARKMNLKWGDARLSVWVNLAEGVLELTAGNDQIAVDRFGRSVAVSRAAGMARELSIAEVWLAYIAFSRNDIGSLAGRLNRVMQEQSLADVSALARGRMLVGQSYHFCGRFELARPWYSAARALAAENGDDVLLSALLFNIASHHVSNYREKELRGRLTSASARELILTSESVRNYDEMSGIDSLDLYAGTLAASVEMFNGRFAAARSIFERYVTPTGMRGLERMTSPYLADLAYCSAKVGDKQAASRYATNAFDSINTLVHLDDLAATRSRLAMVFDYLNEDERRDEQIMLANGLWAQHEAIQVRNLELLLGFDCQLPEGY